MQALQRECIHYSTHLREEFYIHTIYFGGGTPSLISASHLRYLLCIIRDHFELIDQTEISLEANPNGTSRDFFEEINDMGVNRLSVGMQSAKLEELEILDRKHLLEDVQKAVKQAKASGIDNINLDLIFSIPTQTLQSLRESVLHAIDLEPRHLSIYGLILHEDTVLFRKIKSGLINSVDEDLGADMYAWLMRYLPARGFYQYEISNWAVAPVFQSKHNLQYWHNLDYIGIGAGAHSHNNGFRWSNLPGIQSYINGVKENAGNAFFLPAIHEKLKLQKEDSVKETLMMGLRLTGKGLPINAINERFGIDVYEMYRKEIEKLLEKALVEILESKGQQHLRLTEKGRMFGNQVFMAFI